MPFLLTLPLWGLGERYRQIPTHGEVAFASSHSLRFGELPDVLKYDGVGQGGGVDQSNIAIQDETQLLFDFFGPVFDVA